MVVRATARQSCCLRDISRHARFAPASTYPLAGKQGGIRAMDDAKKLVDVPLRELRGLLAKRPSAFAFDHGNILELYLASSSSEEL